MKAVVLVIRSPEDDVFALELVGDFEYKPENYREKILKLKELLGRAKLE